MPTLPQRYDRIAPWYDLLDAGFERKRYAALRPLMFEGLSGQLLDAGVGTGRNCAYYPRRLSAWLRSPWVEWACAARFERQTERHVAEAGPALIEGASSSPTRSRC